MPMAAEARPGLSRPVARQGLWDLKHYLLSPEVAGLTPGSLIQVLAFLTQSFFMNEEVLLTLGLQVGSTHVYPSQSQLQGGSVYIRKWNAVEVLGLVTWVPPQQESEGRLREPERPRLRPPVTPLWVAGLPAGGLQDLVLSSCLGRHGLCLVHFVSLGND